jgi:hypothetical protein
LLLIVFAGGCNPDRLDGRALSEQGREWWSRLGGLLIAAVVVWTAVTAAAVYAPFAVVLAKAAFAVLGIGWIVTTVLGVLSGASSATGKPGANPWLELFTKIAPYVFIVGLLIALSWALYETLVAWAGVPAVETSTSCRDDKGIRFADCWSAYSATPRRRFRLAAGCRL